ncbi:MAG: pyridine nucleotide-disulfide oxidoreductase, partial [Paludibacteraceae bacterium]|nr:pyridine nucleotide-disulfide oxidoreductase [Paludibacteraceae bacterium]
MDNKLLRFKEVEEGYTARQAINEAKRCLNCKIPQCVKGCPIENNIPAFIHQISMGNMGNAMEIINEKSNLPAICGRVCPHEKQCEGHCVMNKKGAPIKVGKLERFAADFDSSIGLFHEKITPKT